MHEESGRGSEFASVNAMSYEKGLWRCHTTLRKFHGDSTDEADLFDVVEIEDNIFLNGGISALFHRLIGGTAITAFDNANAAIGVGDSSTAAAATQTDLQAATNKLRRPMDSTYPQHTDNQSTNAGVAVIWRGTFGTGDANYAWNEWGIFNSATAGAGRMLNRRVQSLGTKAAGSTWQLTVQTSIT